MKIIKKNRKSEASVKLNIKMWKLSDVSYEEAKELIKGMKPTFEKHNIIVTAGRTVFARLLSGDATYSGEINYGALGSDATAVTNADTVLGTEVYRKIASSQTYDENICYVDFFYSASDTDGTYEEFGNFIDGAAGADTGQLFSHMITGSWVKTNTESLFVSCQYSII